MLERLLALILEKGAVSPAELATEFDISPEMLESMLSGLERLGYLEAVEGCASGACRGCSTQAGCRPVRMWKPGKRNIKVQ
ncbi:MAG TPA: FeoC-like transcriptional regulator [Anaerolineales bacterium]|nr:FeoC-like transcriptional regulator [Anaerolineales bacterium]